MGPHPPTTPSVGLSHAKTPHSPSREVDQTGRKAMVGECTQVHSHGSRNLRSLDAFRPTDIIYQYATYMAHHLHLIPQIVAPRSRPRSHTSDSTCQPTHPWMTCARTCALKRSPNLEEDNSTQPEQPLTLETLCPPICHLLPSMRTSMALDP